MGAIILETLLLLASGSCYSTFQKIFFFVCLLLKPLEMSVGRGLITLIEVVISAAPWHHSLAGILDV